MFSSRIAACWLGTIALLIGGCGGSSDTAKLTEVELTVTINGKPLPNANVTLTPTNKALGSQNSASGITDESGKAKMMVGTKPGAAIGVNLVTVADAPVGEEARGESAEAQMAASKQQWSQKNRPIPMKYQTLAQSDINLDIKEGQKDYTIELKR